MSFDTDHALVEKVKQQLDRHAESVDELTLARLVEARRLALARHSTSLRYWIPLGGLAMAAAVALVSFMLVQQPQIQDIGLELWVASDDLELIEELDFYAWLEETQSNS